MTTAEDEESEYKCHNCQILCKRGDPSLIRAIGNIYHQQCFRCDFCQASVIEKFYLLELDSMLEEEMSVNNIILCEKDYYKHSRFKCHQCNGDIKNDHFQIIGPHKYHQHCLHCPGCTVLKNHVQTAQMDYEKENEPKKYFDYNGRLYCRYHYSLIKGTECVGCRQAILYHQPPTKRPELSINPKWHPECYKMKKFWNIQLIDLQPLHPSVYKSEKQLISVQNEFESKRIRIWKEISQFENNVSKALSVIVQCKQQSEEFHACQVLLRLINILFTVLDSLFEHITHLSCDDSVQSLSDQLVSFLDVLCLPYTEQDMDSKTKMVNAILNCIRDLVKLSLQQAFILERNFGEAARYNSIIHQMLIIFSNNQYKKIMEMASLDHHFQLIDMAITRLGFVLNINPQQQDAII
ncbi:MAG: hypothetical protein EXX96DRAFT_214785 [Benjaminiella poitrasii]|nr:MAG: hypothetical protein EXX96DRAFT_214785 [Benjaminiella poitrasii]